MKVRPLFTHHCFLCGESFTSTKQRKLVFCLECQISPNYEIACKIRHHLKRAMVAGAIATLTTDEWIGTINYYNGMCAYCLNLPGTVIEHYIPLELGGGTTKENCIPACHGCNHHKKSLHPHLVLQENVINRIEMYLYGGSERVA